MSHWRCCCGGGVVDGCCGCSSCPSTITLEVVESYTLAWTGGGSCDLSRSIVRTILATFVRTTDPDNSCPPPGQPCPGACEWIMSSGTLTGEEAWLFPSVPCGTNSAIPDVVIPLTSDDSFARFAIRCGTCGSVTEETDVWRIEVRQSASINRFQVRSITGNVSVCPEQIEWDEPTVPTPPNAPSGFAVEDYSIVWGLSS